MTDYNYETARQAVLDLIDVHDFARALEIVDLCEQATGMTPKVRGRTIKKSLDELHKETMEKWSPFCYSFAYFSMPPGIEAGLELYQRIERKSLKPEKYQWGWG